MKIRLLTVLMALSLAAAFSIAGDPDHEDGPNDCPPNEGQGGTDGTAEPDELNDPVYLPRGEFIDSHVDIFLPGRGLDVYLERSYRSRSRVSTGFEGGRRSAMGLNWSHNYEMWIETFNIDGLGQPYKIEMYLGNERMVTFDPETTATTTTYSADQYDAVIEYTTSLDPVKYITSDNTTYQFFPTPAGNGVGMLESITDRNGNVVTITYENGVVRNRIMYVSDGLGNRLDFSYYSDPNAPWAGLDSVAREVLGDLLWKVTDHVGREVVYEYQFSDEFLTGDLEIRQLTEVVLPAHKEASGTFVLPPEHERFLNGRSIKYDYHPNSEFTGLLTKITDENGLVILENTYEQPLFNDYFVDRSRRLYRQVFAGDTYTHMLTNVDGSNKDPSESDEIAIWVQKRDGFIVKLVYSGGHVFSQPDGWNDGHKLISRTDYPGKVPQNAEGKLVWFDEAAGASGRWKFADTPTSQATVFDLLPAERSTDVAVTKNFGFDDEWSQTSFAEPNGDVVEYKYNSGAGDARSRQSLTEVISKPGGTVVDGNGDPITSHPDWITTTYEYDGFSFWPSVGGGCGCGSGRFATTIIDGNGNHTEKDYDVNGNVTQIRHDIPGGLGTPAAIENYSYVPNGGGNVATYTHAETTRLVNGSPQPYTPVDEYLYYPDAYGTSASPENISSNGKVKTQIVDINGEILETHFEYDAIGNVSKITEPDGDVRIYLYNQGRQLVREQYWDSAAQQTLLAQTDYFYDANGNVVIEKVKNIDDSFAVVLGNPTISTVYEYDLRDLLTKQSIEQSDIPNETVEEDSSHRATAPTGEDWVTQAWVYDANGNLIEFQDGEAVRDQHASLAGDANNKITYEYDFRELLYRQTNGAGSATELVVQFDYDVNKRLEKRIVNPDAINGLAQTEQFLYDGHGRLISITDPKGNVANFEYDKNHNRVEVEVLGPYDEDLDIGGGDTAVVLYNEVLKYDSKDRMIEQDISVFDYLSGAQSAVQHRITTYTYNKDSSLRQVDAPSGQAGVSNATEYFYDSVGRLEYIEDGAGNTVRYGYDLDSNLALIDQIDLSTIGSGQQRFTKTYTYDELDRRVTSTDGALNLTQWGYDSRSNMVKEIDGRGNLTSYDYDGLSRLIASQVRMTADGDGPENDPALATNAEILTTMVYDDSSRVIAETDDNGQTTGYAYDAVNRRTAVMMPVISENYLTDYNNNGVASKLTDARGVVLDLTYDLNNRLTRRAVNVSGAIPAGSQFEDFTYDGLGRITVAENLLTRITRSYDSRGLVVREIQNADGANSFPIASDRVVDYEFDLADNTSRILYPHGRDIERSYDSINRLIAIDDVQNTPMSVVTGFDYVGRRLERRNNGNSTRTAYEYDGYQGALVHIDDHGFGRVSKIKTTKAGVGTLDEFSFRWDESQNRTSYKDDGSGMKNRRERAFGYDSSDRLVSTDVDFPDPNTDFPTPTNNGITAYDLDGVHNRFSVTGFEEAGAPIGIYKDVAEDLPDHVKNNQYTFSPREGGGQWIYSYDKNGNMVLKAQYDVTDFTGDYELDTFDINAFLTAFGNQESSADFNNDGLWDNQDIAEFLAAFTTGLHLDNQHYTYDFRNQLIDIEFKNGSDVLTTVSNTYDPFARRVLESVDDGTGAIENQLVYGCSSLWEVIEKIQLDNGTLPETLVSTHIYGLGIDDEVSYRIEDLVTTEDYWSHRDDLNSLTSVTDVNGDVKERYQYGDYGQVTIFDPATGLERVNTDVYAIHLYTGRSLITGTGLFDYRFRVMDPETGQFRQRDPLGYVDSMSAYGYVQSSPLKQKDPFGLYAVIPDYLNDGNVYDNSYLMPSNYNSLQSSFGFNPEAPYMVNKVAVSGGHIQGIMYNIDDQNDDWDLDEDDEFVDKRKWWQKEPFDINNRNWNFDTCQLVCEVMCGKKKKRSGGSPGKFLKGVHPGLQPCMGLCSMADRSNEPGSFDDLIDQINEYNE